MLMLARPATALATSSCPFGGWSIASLPLRPTASLKRGELRYELCVVEQCDAARVDHWQQVDVQVAAAVWQICS